MQEQVTALEAQLQEKEQLVSALTDRLEQAAEQLDRIRRTGGDRNMRIAGGVPAELVENQQALVEDLTRAVQQWEEAQPGATLGRLEIQLTELRDLIVGGAIDDAFIASAGAQPTFEAPVAVDNVPPVAESPENEAADGSYEALKSSMLEGEEEAPADAVHTHGAELPESVEEIEHVDPPEPIDVTTVDTEELQHAVEARDTYITYLIKKLRASESRARGPVDWQALDNAPEELQTRLEELERRLEESLRLAEVEQSLQRAKLGREESKLRQQQQQIEKELKRLELEADDDEYSEEGEGLKGSRWLRLLGKRHADGADD